jgi:hypothetical protein
LGKWSVSEEKARYQAWKKHVKIEMQGAFGVLKCLKAGKSLISG